MSSELQKLNVSQNLDLAYGQPPKPDDTNISPPFKTEAVPTRLPLYGPLDVKNISRYLTESKERFGDLYNKNSPFTVNPKDFEVISLLGKGAFGKVLFVKNKSDKHVFAMKAMEKRHIVKMKQVAHALNEKKILQCIDFPFAVRMEYFAKDNSYIYFFMPFIAGGEMFDHLQKIGRFTDNQSRFYAAQVVLGLEYLHHLRLVYRDLKPENLLIDHLGFLKITDFGFCKPVIARTYTFCGTPHYLAPEVISGHGYGTSCDWWSLGILIFEMNAGHPPFDHDDQMIMFKCILNNRYAMPAYFSPALKDIISNLLQTDITKRFGNLRRGAEDIKSHEWFRPTNWLDVFNRRGTAPFRPPARGVSLSTQRSSGDVASALEISDQDEFKDEFKDF